MVSDVTGRTRLYPILGDPVEYAESPDRLTRTFASHGQDAACVPMQVVDGDLGPVMDALARTKNVDGLLITMPHKAAAFALCPANSAGASTLGVVSVVRRASDGSWYGDMLDGDAFVKAQRDAGAEVRGTRALLIGAGAAGSAIAVSLLEQGVADLLIHDRDAARAERLVSVLEQQWPGQASAGAADPTDRTLVSNATPMGMADGDPLPLDPSLLTASMFVGDVIAGHGETPFVHAARAAGCSTADGGQMVAAVQQVMVEFFLGAAEGRAPAS